MKQVFYFSRPCFYRKIINTNRQQNCGDSSHKKDTCPVKESKNFRCAKCNGNHMSNFYECPVRLAIVKARQGKQNSISQLKPTSKQNSPSVPVTHSGAYYGR